MSKAKTFFKRISGVQAYQDHKESKKIKLFVEEKQEYYINKTNGLRDLMNESIKTFGAYRLQTLKETLGVFLQYLKDLEHNNKEGYYEILEGCDIPQSQVLELQKLSMSTSEILKTAGTSSALGLATVSGVPTAVTGLVGTLASASTGTAISTLTGVAKTNAILAWLGGGSLASGGGGMAAGAVVLGATTAAATGIVLTISAGLIASSIYSKKLTSAKEFESKVDIACKEMEASWDAMNGVIKRIQEINDITHELYDRILMQLQYLEPLIPDYNYRQQYHLIVFQRTALLMKSFSELAKTPLFNDKMELSLSSKDIIIKTRQILNTEI